MNLSKKQEAALQFMLNSDIRVMRRTIHNHFWYSCNHDPNLPHGNTLLALADKGLLEQLESDDPDVHKFVLSSAGLKFLEDL